jgi:hypothetical protein
MSSKSTPTSTIKTKRKNRSVATNAPSSKKSKKEKNTPSSADATNEKSDFSMLKLEDIRAKLELLCKKVPRIPEGNFLISNDHDNKDENSKTNNREPIIDETATREWAAQLQVVLEEFNLYVCCVGTATYKWGTERSGAGDQNLTLLLSEMSSSQEQISTAVTPRLTNLLAPVVDLVIEKTITYQHERTLKNSDDDSPDKDTKPIITEVKENHFARKLVDPAFLSLCHKILARNAPLLRHVVLSNFHKLLAAMKDFLKAQESDTQHSRSFTY